MSRPTLEHLRTLILDELDGDWTTPTELSRRLDLTGNDWYRVALTLERLANDRILELKHPGSGQRRFRRHQEPPS